MNHSIKSWYRWALVYLHLNFFITLITLPVLICWGMPFSLLTIVGNTLFNPVLILFLIVSLIVFILEIIGIPNSWCIYLLEWYVYFWNYATQLCESNTVLCALHYHSWWWLLIFVPLVILHRRAWRHEMQIIVMILFFITLLVSNYFYRPDTITFVPLKKAHIPCIVKKRKSFLVLNHQALHRMHVTEDSIRSWISYTLRPHIIKHTGSSRIDAVYIIKPCRVSMMIARMLCKKKMVCAIIPIGSTLPSTPRLRRTGRLDVVYPEFIEGPG